jgi:formamidopyrimidine-DNA glycosylase
MPEFPDIELYRLRLEERLVGRAVHRFRIINPFVLRTVKPTPQDIEGNTIIGVSRLGKRIVLRTDQQTFILFHLMISGRFQWQEPVPTKDPANGKLYLATLDFDQGRLSLVESSTRKRASIHLVGNESDLVLHRRPGISVFDSDWQRFDEQLRSVNRTLKRALTSPDLFDGIGNAYSDEILHAAKLSPIRLSRALNQDESIQLFEAARKTLSQWRDRLVVDFPGFPRPNDITAFRKDFAVHGRFGQSCPVCGKTVQRIVYSENETNYCAQCQNEGRMLADRSLSRLLKSDWPKTLEEMDGH